MDTTNRRMVAVAVLVCGFAVGIAGLLNYFKYRSTSNRFVTERLVVTGRSVENAVQGALDLGLQFSELGTLPETLKRESSTDELIAGIDIFDRDGKLIYSTDGQRAARPVPASWLAATAKARGEDWMVEDGENSAVGTALKNSFGVTLAQLALRYSSERISGANAVVARDLALQSVLVFLGASAVASTALVFVMRNLARDVRQVEAALRAGDTTRSATYTANSPFGPVLRRFIQTTHDVEREIAVLGASGTREARP